MAIQGEFLILTPEGKETRTQITAEPPLEDLQRAVGGYIELVPGFTSMVMEDGSRREWFVFCNE